MKTNNKAWKALAKQWRKEGPPGFIRVSEVMRYVNHWGVLFPQKHKEMETLSAYINQYYELNVKKRQRPNKNDQSGR